MYRSRRRRVKVGILDHMGSSLGGAQAVAAHMASVLSKQYVVDFIHSGKGYTLKRLATAFDLDLSRVSERTIPVFTESFNIPGAIPFFRQRIWSQRILSKPYDLFIYSGHGVPPFSYARRSLVYCHFPMESCPEEGLKKNARWIQRNPIDRRIRLWAYRLLWRIRIDRYSSMLANSRFTASWIERRWGKPAEVLYPPVEFTLPSLEKRNLAVSVGRFTGSTRSKNQLEQVKAFRQFLTKVTGGWSLCLIGSCSDSTEEKNYLDVLQQAARELPVTFLVNADRKLICQVLAEAKLFWHTAGLAVNETERPHDGEHFGIATVEAMRAGCVPIVIDSGGQREIVDDGVSGFLTKSLDELNQKSMTLARDHNLLSVMSMQAKQRSMAFTSEVFDQRLSRIVSECLNR